MEITPENIQKFLDDKGYSRAWIEKTLGVSPQTVRSWFFRKSIPSKYHKDLEQAMSPKTELPPAHNYLTLQIDLQDFKHLEKVALESGETITECATRAFMAHINAEYEKLMKKNK